MQYAGLVIKDIRVGNMGRKYKSEFIGDSVECGRYEFMENGGTAGKTLNITLQHLFPKASHFI
jgi:hypothetical protein